ncbi:hypothetical protein Syun_014553 [Stephania yunnanensis]|uniref:Uncharacterized protein n=1 Tax=Stephania yunnanensis TaxID=152371 RepID=A0AAP0JJK9_9MAGN
MTSQMRPLKYYVHPSKRSTLAISSTPSKVHANNGALPISLEDDPYGPSHVSPISFFSTHYGASTIKILSTSSILPLASPPLPAPSVGPVPSTTTTVNHSKAPTPRRKRHLVHSTIESFQHYPSALLSQLQLSRPRHPLLLGWTLSHQLIVCP